MRAIVMLGLMACGPQTPETVLLTVEHVGEDGTWTTDGGDAVPLRLAPGLLVQTDDPSVVYAVGEPASEALRSLAEQGDPAPLKAAVDADEATGRSTFLGDDAAEVYSEAAMGPGTVVSRSMDTIDGTTVVVATMLGASNDTFLGTVDGGLDLLGLDLRDPANVTDRFRWFDAGTEVNEPLGEGADQPGVSEPGAGEDEGGVVTEATEGLPAVADVVRITVSAAE